MCFPVGTPPFWCEALVAKPIDTSMTSIGMELRRSLTVFRYGWGNDELVQPFLIQCAGAVSVGLRHLYILDDP